MAGTILDTLAGPAQPQPVVVTSPSTVFVVPYNARDDKISDLLLPSLWKQLKEDGIAELYFPGQSETGFADFVELMSGKGTSVALCALPNEKNEPQTIIGFITWSPMKMGQANIAMAGFEFFRSGAENVLGFHFLRGQRGRRFGKWLGGPGFFTLHIALRYGTLFNRKQRLSSHAIEQEQVRGLRTDCHRGPILTRE